MYDACLPPGIPSMTENETPGPSSSGPDHHPDDPGCCASATSGAARIPTTDARNVRRLIVTICPSSTVREPNRDLLTLNRDLDDGAIGAPDDREENRLRIAPRAADDPKELAVAATDFAWGGF